MSYDIYLKDPISKETLELPTAHMMGGGTVHAEMVNGRLVQAPTTEAWLNITYNYAPYYYEVTDGDSRFAHDEVSAYYADGTQGPVETQYGIRGIYGKTGAESIPMLQDMISRITAAYQKDGEWITTTRTKYRMLDKRGVEIHDPIWAILHNVPHTEEEYQIDVNEGPDTDYWEPTAGNAIRPLRQLMAMAQLRPDGIWDGD